MNRVIRRLAIGLLACYALLFVQLNVWQVGKRADLRISDRVFGHALRLRNDARPQSTGSFISQIKELEQVRELDHARTVAAKIVEAAQVPFELQAATILVGASVGLAFGVDPAKGATDLIARADAKLYLAKRNGRGRFEGPPGEA